MRARIIAASSSDDRACGREAHTMSTNGFISFMANGKAKHAYNHWDSMPDELGVKVLHWLRMTSRDPDALRKAIINLKLAGGTERPYPTEADTDELAAQMARQIAHSTQTTTEWLRFIGGAGGWVHVR
jgi:hypothetical protein